MIELINVSKKEYDRTILDNFSAYINPGDFTVLISEDIFVKNTLIKIISGKSTVDGGRVLLNKISINEFSEKNKIELARQIGYVSTSPNLISNRTLYENIALPLLIQGVSNITTRRKVINLLDIFNIRFHPDQKLTKIPEELRYRIICAREFAKDPWLVCVENIFSLVNDLEQNELIRMLDYFNALGTTIVLNCNNQKILKKYEINYLRVG